LASVEDLRVRAGDEVDVARGQRRNPAKAREEVEGRALAGEHRTRRALDPRDDGRDVRHPRALLEQHLDVDARVERLEDGSHGRDAADDAWLLQEELRAAARVR